jgi:hypothetical protein
VGCRADDGGDLLPFSNEVCSHVSASPGAA